MRSFSLKLKIAALLISLFLIAVLGIVKGSVNLTLAQILSIEYRQIVYLRGLRVLLAMFTGAGLAVSGAALQSVLRNPLAEPYLLGTSSGASLGAVCAIILGVSAVYLPVAAFLAAAATIVLVYALSREGAKVPVQSLILSGVIVSVAVSGLIILIISISGTDALHGVMWWLWGSMQNYDLRLMLIVFCLVLGGIVSLWVLAQDLNAISLGEEEALHLGVDTERLKKMVFLITSLITACLVCVCGIIGFVGLVIPHIMRFIVGPNHRVLLPASCLAGALFLVLADLLSRTILPPFELPIGVVTALIGTPVFIILLKSTQRV